MQNFHLFLRSTTPDNRRICGRYYHYPGHHHPDYLKDPHHVGSHDPHHRTLSGRPVSAHTRRHSKHGSSKSPSRPGSRPLTGTKHLEVRAACLCCEHSTELVQVVNVFSVFLLAGGAGRHTARPGEEGARRTNGELCRSAGEVYGSGEGGGPQQEECAPAQQGVEHTLSSQHSGDASWGQCKCRQGAAHSRQAGLTVHPL
jgi:hypothetical protein